MRKTRVQGLAESDESNCSCTHSKGANKCDFGSCCFIVLFCFQAKSGHEKGTRELALQALSKLCVEDANAEEFLACLGYPVLLAALDSLVIPFDFF